MDDLRSTFDAAAENVPVPPGDVGAVVRRGATRRRKRIAAGLVSASVILVATGGAIAIFGGQEDRPVPVRVGDDRTPGSRLVPLVMKGPTPMPALGSEQDRADARAVTVAFHAFLEGSRRQYLFDYERFERQGDAWLVRFVQFPPPTSQEDRLRDLEVALRTAAVRVRTQRFEMRRDAQRLVEELRDAKAEEARELHSHLAALRQRIRRLTDDIRPYARRVAAVEADRETLASRRPSWTVDLTVAERDGTIFVEDVATDSPDAASLRRIVGYAERASSVDAWGADYYDAVLRPQEPPNDGIGVEVRYFWTGPLYAPYEETCAQQVLGPDGKVLVTRPPRRFPPGGVHHYTTSPSDEDGRDGAMVSFGFDYDGDAADLSLRVVCEWRPRQ